MKMNREKERKLKRLEDKQRKCKGNSDQFVIEKGAYKEEEEEEEEECSKDKKWRKEENEDI